MHTGATFQTSKRPQDASKTPPRSPKIPPRRSKMPSRRPKTSLRRSKKPPRAAKTAKMTSKTPTRHDFEGFWEPKWKHVCTKIASKSTSCEKRRKALWDWKSYYFFNRIMFPGTKKPIPNRSKIIPKLKSRWEGLLTRFFPLLHVFSGPRRSRHPQNASPNTPRWLPRRCQDASQTSKKLPRSLQDRPRCLQDGPRRAQGAPRGLQEPPRPPK